MKSTFAFVLATLAIVLTITTAPHAASFAPPSAAQLAASAVPALGIQAVQAQTPHPLAALVVSLGLLAVLLVLCFNPYLLARALHLLTNQTGAMFQRINRTDAERWFITVYNSYSTAAMSNGQVVAWDYQTDKDGVGVTRPTARATNAGMAAAGVIAEAIAAGGYGLMQVFGYHSAVRARTVTGGTPAIVAGRPLVINAAGSLFCGESVATSSISVLTFPFGFALGATSGFTTAAIAAFVRTL